MSEGRGVEGEHVARDTPRSPEGQAIRGSTSLKSTIFALYRALPSARRKQLLLVISALLLAAFFELITISAIIPFLSLLSAPDAAVGKQLEGPSRLLLAYMPEAPLSPGQITSILIVAVGCAASMRLVILRLSQNFVAGAAHDISAGVFSRTLRQPYRLHVSRNSSQAMASLEKLQIIVSGVLLPLVQGCVAAILVICIGALLFVLDARIAAAAAFALGFLYIGLAALFRRTLEANSVRVSQASAARLKAWREAMGGIRDILLEGTYHIYETKFEKLDLQFRQGQSFAWFAAQAPRFIAEAGGIVLIALLALYMADQPGGLVAAFPILGALALGAQRLMPLVQQVYQGATLVRGNAQILRDVTAILEAPVPAFTPPSAGAPILLRSSLLLENVSFRFDEQAPWVIQHTNLNIRKGDRIGLVGRSGSGKSTFLDLVMGLLEPSCGELRVDDEALTIEKMAIWQRQIAHVPQSIYLADASIAANIAFGVSADAINIDRVQAAARHAQMHDFIKALPAGYDTSVGERGVRFSGGQRQRIAIARALYRDAPLLILDEATSALDALTEEEVIRAVSISNPDMTMLIAAHRPSAFAWCNRIISFEDGRVREQPL